MKESIKVRTMRRVVAVYYLRRVLNRFVLKSVIIVFVTLGFGSLVHVAAVFNNMPAFTNIGSFSLFSYYAFMNTEIAVQAVIVMLGIVTLWLARDIFKQFIPKLHLQYSHSHI